MSHSSAKMDRDAMDRDARRERKKELERIRRQNFTPEQREKNLEKRRNYRKLKRQNTSAEELEKLREKRRIYVRTVRQNQSEEVRQRYRETERRRRLNLNEPNGQSVSGEGISEEEQQQRSERHRIYERSRKHNLSDAEKLKLRERNRVNNRLLRHRKNQSGDPVAERKLRRGTEKAKCPVCLKYFFTFSLQSHMISHLPRAAQPFQCKLCKVGFSKSSLYRMHYREYHSSELPMAVSTFSCDLCPGIIETRVKYMDHLRQHLAAGETEIGEYEEMLYYQCDAQSCFICFRDKTMFDHHVVTAHPNSIICDTCGKVFAVVENYEKHVTVAHNNKSCKAEEPEVTCDYCWQIIKEGDIERHRKQHVMILSEVHTPAFVCPDCGKAFASERSMVDHCRKVHPDNHKPDSTTCIVCTTQFKTIKLLHSHYLNAHTYDHPLVCHICSKEFSYLYLLNSHLRGHEGQGRQTKYHDCGYCTKSFSFHVHRNQHQVLAHASIHLANRPFYCPACFRAFQYESLYNDHMMTHEKFRCHICKEYFLGKQGLNSHMPGHMRSNGPLKRFDFELVRKAKEERLKEVGTLIDTPVVTSGKEMLNMIVKSRKRDFVILGRRGKKKSIEFQDKEDKFQDNEDQDNEDIRSDEDNSQSENEDIIDFSEAATSAAAKIVTQNNIPIEGQGQGGQDEIPVDVIQMFENTKQLLYICDQCPAQFSSILTLCAHLNYHDAQKNGQFHEFDRLGSAAVTRINLDKIDMRSLREKYLNPSFELFKCELCKATFESKTRFINHMNDHETSEEVTGSETKQSDRRPQSNQRKENVKTKVTKPVSTFLKLKDSSGQVRVVEVTGVQNQIIQTLQGDKLRPTANLGSISKSNSNMGRLTSLYLRYQMNTVSSQSSLIASTANVSGSTGSAPGGYANEWDDGDDDVPLEYLEDPLEDPLANTVADTFYEPLAGSSALPNTRVVPLTYLNRDTEGHVQLGEVEVKEEPIQEEFLPEVSFYEMDDSEEPGSIEAVRRRASAMESLLSHELFHKVKALPFLTVQLQRLSENVIPGVRVRVATSLFKIKTEPKDYFPSSLPMSSDSVDYEHWQDDRNPEVTDGSWKTISEVMKRVPCSSRAEIKDGEGMAVNSPSVYSREDSTQAACHSDAHFPRIRKRRHTAARSGNTKKDMSGSTTKDMSRSTTKEGEFSCPRCDKTFEKKRSLQDHIRRHPNESDEYPCTECNGVFRSSNALLLHLRESHLQQCPICKKRFPASFSLQTHIQRHSSNTYNCSVCSKSYNLLDSLKTHHRKVHGRVPSDVPVARVVSEQLVFGPFHCHVCSKTFDYKKRYDRHLRAHFKAGELSPDGPTFFAYFCDGNGCSMQFVHKETFLRHLETHPPSGIAHSCVSCPKVFAEAQSLQSHAQRVHEQNGMECPYCPNSFTVDAALLEHIESIHKLDLSVSLDGDFICDACGQSFCAQRTLDRHKAMEHGHLIGGAIRNRIPYWRKALGGKVSNNEKCSCPVCGKTIGVRSRANHLLSEHTYEHGLSCFICLRQFSRYGRLALHLKEHAQGGLVPPDVILPSKPERIHKKRPRKSCRFCGEVFCDQLRECKHYFNYHRTEYLKDTPFYCVHCYRAFPTPHDLETHQAKMHDRLKCEECGKQYLNIDLLRAHMQRHNR